MLELLIEFNTTIFNLMFIQTNNMNHTQYQDITFLILLLFITFPFYWYKS